MSNFERLQDYVAEDAIRIVHIEAIPRSISTALARSLNEAEGPSVYVNEPFNRMHYDIEEASGSLLDAVEPMLEANEEKITVVTKNMARNLNDEVLDRWIGVCDSTAWSIRDPLVQMGSLITRIANDLAYAPGADRIKQEDLTREQIQAASNFLYHGPVSQNFSKTSWADIGDHFRKGYHTERAVVIDGGQLTAEPIDVLTGACKKLGLTYSQRMVEGWEGDFINANSGYSTTLTDQEHAWTGHAATSAGLVSTSRTALDVSILPAELQAHLTEVAIPVYEEMTGRKV